MALPLFLRPEGVLLRWGHGSPSPSVYSGTYCRILCILLCVQLTLLLPTQPQPPPSPPISPKPFPATQTLTTTCWPGLGTRWSCQAWAGQRFWISGDRWQPHDPAQVWGPIFLGQAPHFSCYGVWAASYLRGEVLGHNFLPFFSQFFIWSNFIFCLKQKKEKNSKRFAHECLRVTEPLGPQEKTPWSGPSPPIGQGAEVQGGQKV